MIKANNVCVSKCLLHCLKQTESKYGEALVHSDGLSKYTSNVENLRNEDNNVLSFSVKKCLSHL